MIYSQEETAARTCMWHDILGMHNSKTAKRNYAKNLGMQPHEITPENYRSLAPSKTQSSAPTPQAHTSAKIIVDDIYDDCYDYDYDNEVKVSNIPSKGSTTMYNDYTNTAAATIIQQDPTVAQREYLTTRLYNIVNAKDADLSKDFHLYDAEAPTTLDDLKDRLANGKYTIDLSKFTIEGKFKAEWPFATDIKNGFSWRTFPADRDSYDAAWDKLRSAQQAVSDTIAIGTPAEGLKALQDFEATPSTTFH